MKAIFKHVSKSSVSLIAAGVVASMLPIAANAAFYAGTGLGVRPLSANFTKFRVTGVDIKNIDESVTRPAVDFFVGYDHVFNHGIYLAGEATYEYVDMSASVGTTVSALGVTINERASAELDSNFAVATLFGYKSSNADIFYGRFGLLFDELHYKASQQVGAFSSSTTEGKHYAGAVQLGIGAIHPFNKHFSIRGEYTYTRYPNVGVTIHVTVPTIGPVQIVRFTPEVSINAATVSLLYAF